MSGRLPKASTLRLPTPSARGPSVPRLPKGPRAVLPIDIPAPDPLADLETSGDIEADTDAQLGAIETGFRARMKAEAERFAGATSTDYYCALVFQNGDQLQAFLSKAGIGKPGARFVDGVELAAALGIDIPACDTPRRPIKAPDARLMKMARPLPKP